MTSIPIHPLLDGVSAICDQYRTTSQRSGLFEELGNAWTEVLAHSKCAVKGTGSLPDALVRRILRGGSVLPKLKSSCSNALNSPKLQDWQILFPVAAKMAHGRGEIERILSATSRTLA
jgi:hypothetical protein